MDKSLDAAAKQAFDQNREIITQALKLYIRDELPNDPAFLSEFDGEEARTREFLNGLQRSIDSWDFDTGDEDNEIEEVSSGGPNVFMYTGRIYSIYTEVTLEGSAVQRVYIEID